MKTRKNLFGLGYTPGLWAAESGVHSRVKSNRPSRPYGRSPGDQTFPQRTCCGRCSASCAIVSPLPVSRPWVVDMPHVRNAPAAAVQLRARYLRSKTALRSGQNERVDRKLLRPSMRHQFEAFGQERLQRFGSLLRCEVGWHVRDDVIALFDPPWRIVEIANPECVAQQTTETHVGDDPAIGLLDPGRVALDRRGC